MLKGISKNSKNSFSLWEKAGMRVIKSSNYIPHPSPLPEGEGIIGSSLKSNGRQLLLPSGEGRDEGDTTS
jgi:hypothetical protein